MPLINIPSCQNCGKDFVKDKVVAKRFYLKTGHPVIVCEECFDKLKKASS